VRFLPPLNVDPGEIVEALQRFERALATLETQAANTKGDA